MSVEISIRENKYNLNLNKKKIFAWLYRARFTQKEK